MRPKPTTNNRLNLIPAYFHINVHLRREGLLSKKRRLHGSGNSRRFKFATSQPRARLESTIRPQSYVPSANIGGQSHLIRTHRFDTVPGSYSSDRLMKLFSRNAHGPGEGDHAAHGPFQTATSSGFLIAVIPLARSAISWIWHQSVLLLTSSWSISSQRQRFACVLAYAQRRAFGDWLNNLQ